MINERILFISDLHAPYMHEDTISFLGAIKEKYNPTQTIIIGDEIDFHSLNAYQKDPDLESSGKELESAIKALQPIYELFPVAKVVHSNHSSRIEKCALAVGLPRKCLKSYKDIIKAPPGWSWHDKIILYLPDNSKCYICHKKQSSDVKKCSQRKGMSFVQGHYHNNFDIQYWHNEISLLFGMTVGCLIDNQSYAMNYNRIFDTNPILGIGLIINSIPKLIPMVVNKKNRWVGHLQF